MLFVHVTTFTARLVLLIEMACPVIPAVRLLGEALFALAPIDERLRNSGRIVVLCDDRVQLCCAFPLPLDQIT